MADTLAIMPTYLRNLDDYVMTRNAIRSLRATCDADLLVVSDGSPSWAATKKIDELADKMHFQHRISGENQGFSASANIGLRMARGIGQHALLVNSDTFFMNNGWLDNMRANEADVVGALLLYPNGLVQHAGIYFSVISRRFDHIYRLAPHSLEQLKAPRICPVTGALMLIKHNTLKEVGILDANFKFGYEDVDYCHMVFQSGMTCAYEPSAVAVHHESWFAGGADKTHRRWIQDGWTYLHEKHKGKEFGQFIPTMIGWDE